MNSPKKPKKTAEESAIEIRQRSLLDKEIEESEQKFKAMARGKLGRQSFLSGAPSNSEQAAGGRSGARGGSGSGSMLGGGGSTSTSSGGASPSAGLARRVK